MKLYKLKSNPKTIVSSSDGYTKVEWSDSMAHGYDSRWMIARLNKDNLIKLTKEEVKEVKKNIKEFERIKEENSRLEFKKLR